LSHWKKKKKKKIEVYLLMTQAVTKKTTTGDVAQLGGERRQAPFSHGKKTGEQLVPKGKGGTED